MDDGCSCGAVRGSERCRYAGHVELLSAGGDVLSITLFDSDDNAAAAERTFDEEMPSRLGDLFKSWEGRRVSVDRYNAIADIRG